MEEINKLLEYQKDITDIQYTINLLRWDLKIETPKSASNDLINLISSYESKLFKLETSQTYEKLLLDVINSSNFKNVDDAEQKYINHLYKHFVDNNKIPENFYNKYSKLKSESNIAWREAKEHNDYKSFKPYLKDIIEMTKQYYRYIDNKATNLYDVMLNNYEIGINSNIIDKLFAELKEALVPLIKSCSNFESHEYLKEYSDYVLIECAEYLLKYIGFDMNKGSLGIYPHGFTEKMSANDIRIAFKHTNNPINFLTTIIHEGGHGIFEQNISSNLSRYENTSIDNLYALHESQSRFYENILGRNINFWIPIYSEIQKKLRLDLSIDEFIKLLNNIKPGLIRTEADELTYSLHIILRYEIERDIFNGVIDIDDLPKIWNSKMKEYLNVQVKNDTDGLMQDIHWSEGDFGYFPSYLLGTIYDGMFKELIERDLGNIDDLLKNGRIKEITNYLINIIYKNGGAYTSQEIINKNCNESLSVKPIIEYFELKYKK